MSSSGIPLTYNGNYSFYAAIDQMIWQSDSGSTLNAFGRAMGTPRVFNPGGGIANPNLPNQQVQNAKRSWVSGSSSPFDRLWHAAFAEITS